MNSKNSNSAGLKIGAAAIDITPPLDNPLAGYYYGRKADGIHDNLFAKSIVLDDGKMQLAIATCDLAWVPKNVVGKARALIQEKLAIPPEQVLISATHAHTGPVFTDEYEQLLYQKIADSIQIAAQRLTAAKIGAAAAEVTNLSFNRRYLMKDGKVTTNPGFLNPDVIRPVSPIDPMLGILYFEDLNNKPLATFVNFALHLDTIGGTLISADYPHFLSQILKRVKGENILTLFTQGCSGDVNHWDVFKAGPQRGFKVAERIGTILAGEVIKNYPELEFASSAKLNAAARKINLPVQSFTSEQIAEAEKLTSTPDPSDVDFVLELVHAHKILNCRDRQFKPFEEEIKVFSIGKDIALVALPGEIFCEFGLAIKKKSPFKYTYVIELAYDYPGYIPTKKALEQDEQGGHTGYECTGSMLKPGAGEMLVEIVSELLGNVG